MKSIIIVGSGGHAKSVIDAIGDSYRIVGLVDDYAEPGEMKYGYPVLGSVDYVKPYVSRMGSIIFVHIAVGDNNARKMLLDKLNLPLSAYATIIHPTAYVSKKDVFIGNGAFIGAFAFVNAGCIVGSFSILNTKASIDHDCIVGDFASLGPAVTLAGNVIICERTQLWTGCNVGNKVQIGSGCIIGGGSFVRKDVPKNTYGYGVPFKAISNT